MPPEWPKLDPLALHGIAGDIVNIIGPHTEADPAALLGDLLACVGNAIGSGPHAVADAAVHGVRLNIAIVGESARARKGTSRNHIRRILEAADPEWSRVAPFGGFGSGESLIAELVDRTDTRLLIEEEELAQLLAVASRQGNILSPIIRGAWDGKPLRRRTAKERQEVLQHHVGVVAHITLEEVRRILTATEAANGFGNRFLWLLARRTRRLPEGGRLDDRTVKDLGRRLADRIRTARTIGLRTRTPAAKTAWAEVYNRVADESPAGLLGAITARAEAQMLRLSLLYCLLDGARQVEFDHVTAAWHLWRYADASAAYIFGEATGDPDVDRLVEAVANAGELDAFDMKQAIGNRYQSVRERAERLGLVVTVPEETGGRARLVTRLP